MEGVGAHPDVSGEKGEKGCTCENSHQHGVNLHPHTPFSTPSTQRIPLSHAACIVVQLNSKFVLGQCCIEGDFEAPTIRKDSDETPKQGTPYGQGIQPSRERAAGCGGTVSWALDITCTAKTPAVTPPSHHHHHHAFRT